MALRVGCELSCGREICAVKPQSAFHRAALGGVAMPRADSNRVYARIPRRDAMPGLRCTVSQRIHAGHAGSNRSGIARGARPPHGESRRRCLLSLRRGCWHDRSTIRTLSAPYSSLPAGTDHLSSRSVPTSGSRRALTAASRPPSDPLTQTGSATRNCLQRVEWPVQAANSLCLPSAGPDRVSADSE